MKEQIITAVAGLITTAIGSLITHYFTKKKYLNDFRMSEYNHKRETYEHLFKSIHSALSLVYETKPIVLLEALQAAACLANKENQSILLDFYDVVNTADGKDVDRIFDDFKLIQPKLTQELHEDFRKIR